jgi:hypothetical protein
MDSLRLGNGTFGTSSGLSCGPLFDTPHVNNLPSPFPIGSEIPGHRLRWMCRCTPSIESVPSTKFDGCSWTAPVTELKRHFASEHHLFEHEEFWCECMLCQSLSIGSEPPTQCPHASCYGGRWQKWCYVHNITDNKSSALVLIQSCDSDGGYSFDPRVPGNWLSFGGQINTTDFFLAGPPARLSAQLPSDSSYRIPLKN